MLSDPSPPTSAFSGEPDHEVLRYRSISLSAVFALLLALAAPLALLGPLFWVVPLLGIAISLAAIVRIYRADPDQKPVGRSLALVGLFASVLFAAAAPSHYFLRQFRVRQQARVVAEEWLGMIGRQQYRQALEAMLPPGQRATMDDESLAALYEQDEDRKTRLEAFVDDPTQPLVRELAIALGQGTEVRFDHTANHVSAGGRDELLLVYEILAEPPFKVQLHLVRENDPLSATGLWTIRDYERSQK